MWHIRRRKEVSDERKKETITAEDREDTDNTGRRKKEAGLLGFVLFFKPVTEKKVLIEYHF